VDEVIRRAMAKRPEDRYQSVEELAHAATAALAEVRSAATTVRVEP
jgi:hypothetical protein